MIEPVMYFGIGFLVAALLGLLFVPLVHNRAVRLTAKRLEAATPLSIAEIRADKDQLRAEFAMSTRRLEMSVAQMKTKTTTQLAELGKKTDSINTLKKELSDKTATIFALEARDKTLREQLRATEQEFEIKGSALREAERALADKESELVKLIAELGEHAITSDQQRVELAALRTQVEAMKVSVADYDRTLKDTEHRMTRERDEAHATAADLTEARNKVGKLGSHATELEEQLATQTAEAESLHTRVEELEALLGNQARLLAERDFQLEKLRSDLEAAQRTEADLRGELAATGSRGSAAEDSLRGEIKELEAQLAAAVAERGKLQREVATIKREADATWASERVENALLRERINDVAAEVARLTAALEGPDSPILSMLEEDAPSLVHGDEQTAAAAARRTAGRGSAELNGTPRPSEPGTAASPEKKSLADRIRALQTSASRVASSN
jgi:chromosome segregation ATPase